MNSDDLGHRLRQARTLGNLSAREVDRLAGLAAGHTSLIESGTRPRVEAKTAAKLARVFGVTLDWLVSGLGDTPAADAVLSAVETARAASNLGHSAA